MLVSYPVNLPRTAPFITTVKSTMTIIEVAKHLKVTERIIKQKPRAYLPLGLGGWWSSKMGIYSSISRWSGTTSADNFSYGSK